MAGLFDLPAGANARGGLGNLNGPMAPGIPGAIGQRPLPVTPHPLAYMVPPGAFADGLHGNGFFNAIHALGPDGMRRLAGLFAARHHGGGKSRERLGTRANPHRPARQEHYEKVPFGAYYVHPSGILKIKTGK